MRSIERALLSGTAPAALLALAAFALAQPAFAADLDIEDERTTAVSTSTAGTGGGPADIDITADGSITVSTGPAVVIDSNNDVDNNGTIELTSDTDAVGVRIVGPVSGSFTNNGSMLLSVQDDDGLATGSGNIGVEIVGPGTYLGDLIFSAGSSLTVGGDGATGIALLTPMAGKLTIGGATTVDGTNATAILVGAPLADRFKIEGQVNARGEGARSIWIESVVSDRVWNNGGITVSGQEAGIDYETDDPRPSAEAALGIGASLLRGFQNGGLIDESGGNTAASISASYAAYSLLLSPTVSSTRSDIVLSAPGGTGGEYGFINRGSITSAANDKGESTTSVRIEGLNDGGTIYQTTIEGGLYTSGTISATAVEGTATSFSLGGYASIPVLINKGAISASAAEHADSDTDEDEDGEDDDDPTIDVEVATSIALQLDAGAWLPEIQNSGSITATAAADSATAYAIRDLSGNLTSIYNAGSITASAQDDNDTATSRGIAIDLSLSSAATITNPGNIYGDVLLGQGDDTISLIERVQGSSNDDELDGAVLNGLIEFGGGNDILSIDGDSHFLGGTTKAGGTLTIDVIDGRVTVAEDKILNATQISISGTSDMVVAVDEAGIASPRVVVSNAIAFASGSELTADLTEFVGQTATITLIDAGTIDIAAGLDDLTSVDLPFLYNGEFSLVDGARDQLLLSLDLKSPEELGLSDLEARMFDAVVELMPADDNVVSGLLASATDSDSFHDAFDELVPDTSGATLHAALAVNDARSRALMSRHMTQPKAGSRNKGIWGNLFGYSMSIDGEDGRPGQDGSTFGGIIGIDFNAQDRSPIGLYLEYGSSSFSPDDDSDGEISSDAVGLGAYGIWHAGGFFFASLDAGVAFTHNKDSRSLAFDEDDDGEADAAYALSSGWNGMNYHAEARTGIQASIYGFRVIPSVAYSYIHVSEDGRTEEGGGTGLDLEYDDFDADVHRLELELSVGQSSRFDRGVVFAYDVYGRLNQMISGADNEITARFSGGNETFALPLTELAKSQAIVGTNIGLYSNNSYLTANYEFGVADGSIRHGGSLNVVFKF